MPKVSLNTCKETDPAACRYCGATPEMAAKLAALETEVAAWRALAEHGVSADHGGQVILAMGHDGQWAESRNSDPGTAAIALARQLKLIPEAK